MPQEISQETNDVRTTGCETFNGCLGNNEELAHAVAHNSIRDWIWTYLSYDLLNMRLQVTTDATFDFKGQWAGQQLYATLGMVIFAIASKLAYSAYNKVNKQSSAPSNTGPEQPLLPQTEPSEIRFPTADIAAIIAGAASAVYTWDRGQEWGIQIGAQLGLSPEIAGYFASIFTGGLEGPTQFLAISLVKLLTKDEEWSLFKNNPKNYLQGKLKEFGLSATLGTIPGAVWQIVFNAGVLANLGPIATSFLVAAAVAACNVIYAKTSKAILESKYCINLCGQPTAVNGNDERAATQAAPCSALLSNLGIFAGVVAGKARTVNCSNPSAKPGVIMI